MNDICILPKEEAMHWLSEVRPSKLLACWNGSAFEKGCKNRVSRHARGAGPQVEYISYGLRSPSGKVVGVARISPTPYGNAPAIAAVSKKCAQYTAYLSRLAATGVTSEDVVNFIRNFVQRFPADMQARNADREKRGKPPYAFRYLLSLDDPIARIVEDLQGGVLAQANAATGRVYVQAGALDAGQTTNRVRPTRFVDEAGRLHSLYRGGHNLLPEYREKDIRLVSESVKRRFVFILAPEGSLLYAAWRRDLPAWVKPAVWGENDLGVIQPRLLIRVPSLQAA